MTDESAMRDCPPDALVIARSMAHKAVQPVTRAARANIPATPDESHTNMAWDGAVNLEAGAAGFVAEAFAIDRGKLGAWPESRNVDRSGRQAY